VQGVKNVSQTQTSGERRNGERSEKPAGGSNRPKLLDRMRGLLRTLHYSKRTEEAYIAWVERYLRFHRQTIPQPSARRPPRPPRASRQAGNRPRPEVLLKTASPGSIEPLEQRP